MILSGLPELMSEHEVELEAISTVQ
jgi:hypothetical protein